MLLFIIIEKKRPFRYIHTIVKTSIEILEDKVEEIFQKLVWKKKLKTKIIRQSRKFNC